MRREVARDALNRIMELPRIKKKHITSLLSVLFALILAGGTFVLLKGPTPTVPDSFTAARLQGSVIAQDIVQTVSQSNDQLTEISRDDRAGDYYAALDVSARALNETKEVPKRAVELSKELEIMLNSLEAVYPVEAREKAQAAIVAQVQIITKLVSYNDQLTQLLEELRLKLRANLNGAASPGVAIQDRIDGINREIRSINALSKEFSDLMKEFDSFYPKR